MAVFRSHALAELLIPASLDAKQALRLRSHGLASLVYAVAAALLTLAWAFVVIPGAAVAASAAAFLALNLGVYAAIRSGFNLRFKDPSLTTFQLLAAVTALMYVVYHMDAGRSIALFMCFVIFSFGVYHLSVRESIVVLLYALAAHALVINLLMHLRPQAVPDVLLEWLSWLGLAGLLPLFVFIGAQTGGLRRRLRESEVRFRSLAEMSTDFYWESDAAHRVTVHTFADARAGVMPEFGAAVPIGVRRWEVAYLSPDEAGWRAHLAMLDAHEPFRDFQFSRPGADGTERFLSINGSPLFAKSGQFTGYRGVGTDTTERKRADRAVQDSAEKLRLFADNVPAIAAYWDSDLRCQFANKALLEFWGLVPENVIGKTVREVYPAEAYREVEAHAARALLGHTVTFYRTRERANEEPRHLEIKLVPHLGEQGKALGYFSLATDITEHKRAEARMQRVAHHDSLTGLPNRLLFDDRLEQAIVLARRNKSRFALLYFDLDRFKPVNDTFGHDAGDEILKAVAARIRLQVRESDTFARVGGDEFAVILPGAGRREEAQAVAGKIVAAVAAPFRLGGAARDVGIGASIGIAVFPEDAADADGLIKAADAAMYAAKEEGSDLRPRIHPNPNPE